MNNETPKEEVVEIPEVEDAIIETLELDDRSYKIIDLLKQALKKIAKTDFSVKVIKATEDFITSVEDNEEVDDRIKPALSASNFVAFMTPVNAPNYEIYLKHPVVFTEMGEKNMNIIHGGNPYDLRRDHVIIHEFSHVFDFVVGYSTRYSPRIRENSVEFFAELLAWYIIKADLDEALSIAKKYAIFRSWSKSDYAQKEIVTAVKVIYLRCKKEFQEIHKLF